MKIILGIIAKLLSCFIRVKKQTWIFSSDYGNNYREGSKYLIEYMLLNHPEYDCVFITKNKSIFTELKQKGIPCLMNNSIKAIIKIAQADSIFFTQCDADIDFAFKKQGRKIYYLVHGMPLKRALGQLPKDYVAKLKNKKTENLFFKFKEKIRNFLIVGFSMNDINMVSACSEFLAQFMKIEFSENTEVKVLGMPRNDALFDSKRMKKEKWLNNIQNKLIITYMPTHRGYGTGAVTPTPFVNRKDIQKWMVENDVVLLMKNHPNMSDKINTANINDVIIDITKMGFDPQVCIYHSDVLITDFSSVWMDYLLLQRPIIFYIYDNFEQNDVGTYYDIKMDPPGSFCYSEEELFALIQKTKNNYENMKPPEHIITKYHTNIDGNSCQRYFEEIKKRYIH